MMAEMAEVQQRIAEAPAAEDPVGAGRGPRRGEPGRGGPLGRRRRHAGAAGRWWQQPGRGRRGVRRTSGPDPQRRDQRGVRPLRRGLRRDRCRRELGRRGCHRRTQGLGRHRGTLRHPGDDRGDTDPERGRLRPGGQPDQSPGCAPGTASCAGSARSPPTSAPSATAPAGSSRIPAGSWCCRRRSSSGWAISAPRCSTPSWLAPSPSPSASAPPHVRCAKPYSSCVDARRWCSILRTTTPGARGRSSPTRSSRRTPYPRCADLAAVGGTGQDERCLADRTCRLQQGLRQRPGPAVLAAHARPDQPR